jgi:hypothetical protein
MRTSQFRRGVFRRSSLLVFVGLLVLPAALGARSDPTPRVIVLGEVKGAAETVTSFLQRLGLIDETLQWSGGDTILVQTGDLLDGGEKVRATLDLFMKLQDEAPASGGQVIVLMGNHEVINILGELTEVNYLAFQDFTRPDSEARQQQLWESWTAWKARRAESVGSTFAIDAELREQWFAVHPPGWVEYVESMRPDGVYGGWLRSLPVAVKIGDVLFIHGGLSPSMKGFGIEVINRRAAEEIRLFDDRHTSMVDAGLCLPLSSAREMVEVINEEAIYVNSLSGSKRSREKARVNQLLEIQDLGRWGSWSVLDDEGPLWFRGAAQWSEDEHGEEMAAILSACGVKHMVTGQSDGREHLIRARFDNRVLLASVDISDDPWAGGGKPAAIEISDGEFFVLTGAGREPLLSGGAHPAAAGPQVAANHGTD